MPRSASRTPASRVLLIAGLLAIPVAPGSAQEPAPRSGNDPCFRAQPYPACRVFFLTNAGGYVRLGAGRGGSPLRATVDWGAMVNLSSTTAVGGSWFVSLDEDAFSTGPVLHWRRWFGGARALDAAIGIPIAGGDNMRPGTVLGLVKYSPVHWFGIAARPELVRFDGYACDLVSCTTFRRSTARLYVGAETGWFPGLGLSLGAGVTLGVAIILIVAAGGID